MKRRLLPSAVSVGMIISLSVSSVTPVSGLYTLTAAAETLSEDELSFESGSEYAIDGSEGFLADSEDMEDDFSEEENNQTGAASTGTGQEDAAGTASGKKTAGDKDGLIEDPSGNEMDENLVFEITDKKIKEEIEQVEAAEDDENNSGTVYGKLYPPAPLLPGINSFRQGDMRWGTHQYGYANAAGTIPATISSSGCGLMSLVNAVYYMNGSFIDPSSLADWATSHGYRVNGTGTAHALYQAYAQAFGDVYGFAYAGTASSLEQIRSFLHEGGTAIISSDHHLMCVADYDEKKGGYLLLDSAPSSYRGTYPTGYRYLSGSDFAQSIPVYAIFLLKPTRQKRSSTQLPGLGDGLLPDIEFLNKVLTAVPIPSADELAAEGSSSTVQTVLAEGPTSS